MPRPLYYSPRIRRDLITPLYHAAKRERVPMTKLASDLIAQGLQDREEGEARVNEEPDTSD